MYPHCAACMYVCTMYKHTHISDSEPLANALAINACAQEIIMICQVYAITAAVTSVITLILISAYYTLVHSRNSFCKCAYMSFGSS